MKTGVVGWIVRLCTVVVVLLSLPIAAALVLDAWESRSPASLRLTSIWVRDLLGITSRNTLVFEAAWEDEGAPYIRWALRRGADPGFKSNELRAIDSIMHVLGGGCDPPLGPFEVLARSGIELDQGNRGGLLGFAAGECRRPDLVRILLDAGADPARAGGPAALIRDLGDRAWSPSARDLWVWLLDHGLAPCRAADATATADTATRLAAAGQPDLAARLTAACEEKVARPQEPPTSPSAARDEGRSP